LAYSNPKGQYQQDDKNLAQIEREIREKERERKRERERGAR